MGKAQSKPTKRDEPGDEELDELKRVLEEKEISAAQDMMREKLEGWRDVEIKIGVTGDSGVGKSSFINAFRGLHDEDEAAAEVGDTETTMKPDSYRYPANQKITLMDLPGIGTPTFPDLDTYCEKVSLETYDTFFILTASRFTQDDLQLAQKIKDMGKSFFLIRTKLDQDETNEMDKNSPDVEAMVKRIRDYLYTNVKGFGIGEDKIFLISNRQKDRWDFSRLVEAVLEQLPTHQKEALTLSLRILSREVLERKVEVLRSQFWRISAVFYLAFPLDLAALPINLVCSYVGTIKCMFKEKKRGIWGIPFFSRPVASGKDSDPFEGTAPVGCASVPIALAIVGKKAEFFRSQLGLPEENSDQFKSLKPEFQERMKSLYLEDEESVLKRAFQILVKPCLLLSPGPHETAVNSLNHLLNEMKALALDILEETATGN